MSYYNEKAIEDLRKRSGKVKIDSKLTEFLYILMRDHLPAGTVEGIMINHVTGKENRYTNGYLAKYANDVAGRLTGMIEI